MLTGSYKIGLAFCMLVGCATSERTVTATESCAEQATAWCSQIGSHTQGCEVWLNHECMTMPPSTVDVARLVGCLDDIAAAEPGTLGWAFPTSCYELW